MLPGLLINVHHVHDYLTDILEKTGLTFQVNAPWFSNVETLITCDPANIQYILSTKFTNFPKGPALKKIFDVLGDGIFNAASESWDIHRRTTMTLFNHHEFQKSLVTITWNKVEKGLIPVLENVAKLGITVDLQEIIQRFTFDSTCNLVTGHDPASLSIDLPNFPYKQAFADVEEAVLYRHLLPESFWKLQQWLQIGKEKNVTRALHIVDEFLAHCISMKREKLKGTDQTLKYQEGNFDFLTGYVKALEEKSGASENPFSRAGGPPSSSPRPAIFFCQVISIGTAIHRPQSAAASLGAVCPTKAAAKEIDLILHLKDHKNMY